MFLKEKIESCVHQNNFNKIVENGKFCNNNITKTAPRSVTPQCKFSICEQLWGKNGNRSLYRNFSIELCNTHSIMNCSHTKKK